MADRKATARRVATACDAFPDTALTVVIPARAGVQGGDHRALFLVQVWMPACAGMTGVFW